MGREQNQVNSEDGQQKVVKPATVGFDPLGQPISVAPKPSPSKPTVGFDPLGQPITVVPRPSGGGGGSWGGSASPAQQLTNAVTAPTSQKTYEPAIGVYTSPTGVKQSYAQSPILPSNLPSGIGGGGGGGRVGGEYVPTTWETTKDIFKSNFNIAGFNPFTQFDWLDIKIPKDEGKSYLSSVSGINRQGVQAGLIGFGGGVSSIPSTVRTYDFLSGLRVSSKTKQLEQETKLKSFQEKLVYTGDVSHLLGISEKETSLSQFFPKQSVDYNKQTKNAWKYAKDIGLNVIETKDVITTEIPGYSYVDASGQGWEVSPGTTTTTKTAYQLNPMEFVSPSVAVQSYFTSSGASEFTKVGYEVGHIGTKFIGGLYLGTLFGAGSKALALPQLGEYLSVTLPSTFGSIGTGAVGTAKTLLYGAGIGLGAWTIGSSGYSGYSEYSQTGLSGTRGAVVGTLAGAGEVSGFLIGGSEGRLSPFQMQPIVSDIKTGEVTTQTFGIVNPFGKGGTPLFTYTEGKGFNLGGVQAKNIIGQEFQATNQLSLKAIKSFIGQSENAVEAGQLFKISQDVLPKTYKLTSKGTPEVDVTDTKYFSQFNPQAQKVWEKGLTEMGSGSGGLKVNWKSPSSIGKGIWSEMKGFGTTFREASFGGAFSTGSYSGLERGFGSVFIKGEKGIQRLPGDIDINFFGRAIPKTAKFGAELESAMPGRFKFEEGHIYFKPKTGKWDKIFEAFGQDIPSVYQSPLGYKSQYPRSMKFKGGGDIAGQKLGESYTQKWGTLLTAKVSPMGKITIGAREGQEKVIPDIYRMSLRLGELSKKGKGDILASAEAYKNLMGKTYKNINWKAGTFEVPRNIRMESKPSFSMTSLGVSKSLSGFSKSMSSSSLSKSMSSSSISKSLSSLSKSLSSFNSRSSLSSLSSRSSLSSLSSMSSKSSLSSSSSMSRSSYSTSSFGSSFPLISGSFGFGFPATGRKKKKTKKRKFSVAPSLTAEVFDIRGAFPKGGSFGLSPFQIRKIPKSSKNFFNIKF